MDENKDLLNSEPVAENETDNNENVDEFEKTDSLGFDGEFTNELKETGVADESTVSVENEAKIPSKKRRMIQLPVIICGAILLVVLLGFAIFKCFFNTSIVGEWKVYIEPASPDQPTSATSDEPEPVYVFDDEGSFYCQIGTTKQISNYSIAKNEQTGNMDVTIEAMGTTFSYDVGGNIFTGRELKFYDATTAISDESEPVMKFVSTSLNIPKLEKFENFKTDEKLIGQWHYSDGLFTDVTLTVNEDGTFVEDNSGMSIADYVYTVSGDKLKLKFFYTQEETIELTYKVDGDNLYLNNNMSIAYQRVKEGATEENKEATPYMVQ